MDSKLFILFIFLALMGCVSTERMCGYTKFYCNPYYGNSYCGPQITHRCDFLCDQCSTNEAICSACWTCINTDGPLDYSAYQFLHDHQNLRKSISH